MILTLDSLSYALIFLIGLFLLLLVFSSSNSHQFIPPTSQSGLIRLYGQSPTYTSTTFHTSFTSTIRPNKDTKLLEHIVANEHTDRIALSAALLDTFSPPTIGSQSQGSVIVNLHRQTQSDTLLIILALSLTHLRPVIISTPDDASHIPAHLTILGVIHDSPSPSSNLPSTLPHLDLSKVDAVKQLIVRGKAILAGKQEAKEQDKQKPDDLALSFISDSDGILLEYSHINLTASLMSWLGLFPLSAPPALPTRPSPSDTILSFHSVTTPYGFGLALLASYTKATLLFPDQLISTPEELDRYLNSALAPSPTMIFAPQSVATILYSHLLIKMEGDSSFLIGWSRQGKLKALRRGVVSRKSIWDRFLFDGVRKDAGMSRVRTLILEGGTIEASRIDFFRISLGCPIVVTLADRTLLAPLTSTRYFDVQRFNPPNVVAAGGELIGNELNHVGAPTVGTEIKVIGEEADMVAGRRRGDIVFRSPMLPNLITSTSTSFQSLIHSEPIKPAFPPYPNSKIVEPTSIKWMTTGRRGEFGTEGALWL